MTFSDQIKERKQVLNESRIMLTTDTDGLTDALEYRIEELETDLELEKALTVKQKGLLDGELLEALENLQAQIQQVNDGDRPYTGFDTELIDAAIAKAKESMPLNKSIILVS